MVVLLMVEVGINKRKFAIISKKLYNISIKGGSYGRIYIRRINGTYWYN